ncbi:MAG: 23S rRNA (pseudouridine(1915)-N(3))-methyltransferase RlmH [Burkholderiales bacterium]
MKLWLLAVGLRQPRWADEDFIDFAKRFPPEFRFELRAVKAETRGSKTVAQLMMAEADRLKAITPKGAWRVILDERGDHCTSDQLSSRIKVWMNKGQDVAFYIGGPDGLAPELKATAEESLRLSDLTLPHALARVMLAEALYRGWTLLSNHPYHRN